MATESTPWQQRILELTVHELQASNNELERFSYVASHHLQEPLRTIATQCEMLRRRYANRLDEEADGYIDRAVRGAALAQQLILDLLAYSQIQEPKSPFTTVDLNGLLAEIVSTLATPADTIVQVDVGPLPSVVGDRDQLALVFENLLENAVKYRSGDSVSIRLDARSVVIAGNPRRRRWDRHRRRIPRLGVRAVRATPQH